MKISPLVISQIIGVFHNTLTANDKYTVRDCVNLSSLIQVQLSLKRTIYSNIFVAFLQSTSNFKHFEKKGDRHSYFISEITDCERHGETTL